MSKWTGPMLIAIDQKSIISNNSKKIMRIIYNNRINLKLNKWSMINKTVQNLKLKAANPMNLVVMERWRNRKQWRRRLNSLTTKIETEAILAVVTPNTPSTRRGRMVPKTKIQPLANRIKIHRQGIPAKWLTVSWSRILRSSRIYCNEQLTSSTL